MKRKRTRYNGYTRPRGYPILGNRPTDPCHELTAARIERFRKFVKLLIKNNFNATQTIMDLGWKGKRSSAAVEGHHYLKHPKCRELLQRELNKLNRKVELDELYVLRGLMDTAERCMQKEPVLDRKGRFTGEWRFSDSGANKAHELLGKHLRMFTDKVEHTGKDGEPIEHRHTIDLGTLSRLGTKKLEKLHELISEVQTDEA